MNTLVQIMFTRMCKERDFEIKTQPIFFLSKIIDFSSGLLELLKFSCRKNLSPKPVVFLASVLRLLLIAWFNISINWINKRRKCLLSCGTINQLEIRYFLEMLDALIRNWGEIRSRKQFNCFDFRPLSYSRFSSNDFASNVEFFKNIFVDNLSSRIMTTSIKRQQRLVYVLMWQLYCLIVCLFLLRCV